MTFRTEQLAEGVTLILGDCREVLPTLGRFDACVTDPPYGIASVWTKGGQRHGWQNANRQMAVRNAWDDKPPSPEMFDALMAAADSVVVWGGNYFGLPMSRGWLVWNKPERGFSLAEAELAWTNIDTVVRVFDGNRSDPDREHPTQKPLALMEWCMERVPQAQSILDPFMGSGTTGVAAVTRGRSFTGVEIHEPYFDVACRRVSAALKQPDFFIEKPKPLKQEVML